MSQRLLLKPESNNSVTVLLGEAAFRLVAVDAQLLVFPPDGYNTEISDSGMVSINPPVVDAETALKNAPPVATHSSAS